MASLPYEIVDVFTDRPFTGNSLAVVFEADSLTDEQMQTLAREFNLAETVFVLPVTTEGATYRARIFTPETELPFAGHPSVGAAVTVTRRGAGGEVVERSLVQECGAGLLPIDVYGSGTARLTGGQPTCGPGLDPVPLLAAARLTEADYAGPAPQLAGCGLEFPYLGVVPAAMARAAPVPVPGVSAVYVFAWEPSTREAHARGFFPGMGITEDPATGSAALGLGVFLVASGVLPGDGESAYTVRQGYEIHRPSTLDCTVSAVDGVAVRATVAGQVVPVASGRIAVPPFVG
ncbi:MAG: PhzF family phenazine biosynthesis protein [Micromonosporaceae bacterium]|nr:PhzF family phenazine biosynthesis protein [Micromonosporaceae bacterium]